MQSDTTPGIARRSLTGLLLLVQLVLVGALPFADLLADAVGPTGPHIEATGGDAPCPPPHDHQKCQFCRHDGTFRARLSSESFTLAAPGHRRTYAQTSDVHFPASRVAASRRSRAPPSA